MTNEQLDAHLDAILKASESALRHYTMKKSKDDMLANLKGQPTHWQPLPNPPKEQNT